MNDEEFNLIFGMSIADASKKLAGMRKANKSDFSVISDRANKKPTELNRQLEWSSNNARKRKIAENFV